MVDPDQEPTRSTATETDQTDDTGGVLDALLAEIKSWDGPDEAEETAATTERPSEQTGDDSPHPADLKPPRLVGDPIDRVRTILDSRDLPEVSPLPDPADQDGHPSFKWIAAAAFLSIVLSTLLLTGTIPSMLSDRPATTALSAESGLYLDAEDATYLNRVYRETTNEVAYCGGITTQDGTPTLEIWMADTIRAGPGHIEFETTNCPERYQDVLVHTHPDGTIALSPQDKETLQARTETIMCVQAGPVTTTPGETTQNLACYRQQTPTTGTLELIRIPITITD